MPTQRTLVPMAGHICCGCIAAMATAVRGRSGTILAALTLLVVAPVFGAVLPTVKVTDADPTDKRLKQALGRVRNLRLGLHTAEASALLRILNGDNVLGRMASNSTRVAVGALKNMGSIALNDEGVFEATGDLRLAVPDL